MGVRFLPDRSPFLRGPTSTDTDVALWVAAVVANAGLVSDARVALVSAMVTAWKVPGTWALLDDAWLLVAENVPQALTSLKQRRLAVSVSAPAFTIDRGYAFSGSAYIDTLFTPSVNAVAMTGTSLHIAAYERTNVASNGAVAGSTISSTQNLTLNPRTAGNIITAQLNCNTTGGGGDTILDSRGLTVGSRNGTLAADVLAYRNGVAAVPVAPTTLIATLPTSRIFIGARSDGSNVAATFRASTLGFVSVGAAIPAGQQPAFYNGLQTLMTAVGANV